MVSGGSGMLPCCDGVYFEVEAAGPVEGGGGGGSGPGAGGAFKDELFISITRGGVGAGVDELFRMSSRAAGGGVGSTGGGTTGVVVAEVGVKLLTVRVEAGGSAGLLSTDAGVAWDEVLATGNCWLTAFPVWKLDCGVFVVVAAALVRLWALGVLDQLFAWAVGVAVGRV